MGKTVSKKNYKAALEIMEKIKSSQNDIGWQPIAIGTSGADLGQSFLCEKGTDWDFPDSYVKIMHQRFPKTLPSAYICCELNDLTTR